MKYKKPKMPMTPYKEKLKSLEEVFKSISKGVSKEKGY